MRTDLVEALSTFLQFRSLLDPELRFSADNRPKLDIPPEERTLVSTAEEVDVIIGSTVQKALSAGPTGIMLSGGIDSILVASHLPPGTPAYTFRIVDGVDESPAASVAAEKFELDHHIIDVTWEDYVSAAPALFARKGAPFHSIEAQIYKAGVRAKSDGIENLLFGENADIAFGGFDGLLGTDWTFDEFVARYSHVDPRKAVHQGFLVTWPFEEFRDGDGVAVHEFMNEYFYREANGSYTNACETAGVHYWSPFRGLALGGGLDVTRVRAGEPKYLLRELFATRIGAFDVPKKIPMARGVDLWLADWEGPTRPEFQPNCVVGATGDQRWLLFVAELFLDWLDGRDVVALACDRVSVN